MCEDSGSGRGPGDCDTEPGYTGPPPLASQQPENKSTNKVRITSVGMNLVSLHLVTSKMED